ncbi:MAG: recombinase family protein [Chloroflexota bacterium]
MTTRALLYARTSSDDRERGSLDGQIEMCRDYALQNGYSIVEEIKEDDRGVRGADFDLPGLNRALELAGQGAFDVLVVRELDRFARKLAKQLVVEEEFKRTGVAVEYVIEKYDDTPEGNLMKNVRAVIAEYEAGKISQRMVRGRQRKVKEGNVMTLGNPPYGYRQAEKDGKQVLEIHEQEAQVIRMIFQWYTEGNGTAGPLTINEIARKLSALKIPAFTDSRARSVGRKRLPHRYGQWGRGTVHRMLQNENYIGIWRYGKRKYHNGHWETTPSDNLLTIQIPPIVTPDIWAKVQAQLRENRLNRGRRRYNYLLSRRVTCGACGLKMNGSATGKAGAKYLYYRCPAKAAGPISVSFKCDAPGVKASQVDTAVWEWVKGFLDNPAALQIGLEKHQKEQGEATEPLRQRLAVTENLIADHRGQLERLLTLYLSGEFPKEMLLEHKARLETTIKSLERERGCLLADLEARALSKEQVRSIQEFAAEIARGLGAAEQDFARRRRIIELLDVRATLAHENGEKVIYASCLFGGKF